jgi:hypothetical protein
MAIGHEGILKGTGMHQQHVSVAILAQGDGLAVPTATTLTDTP